MSDGGILLEAGTNELEILEFSCGGVTFGINAAKVQDVLELDPARTMRPPGTTASVIGAYRYRDAVLALIDLAAHLGLTKTQGEGGPRQLLISKVNGRTAALLLTSVRKIHRVSWTSIYPVPKLLTRFNSPVTAHIELGAEVVQMLDLEQVMADLDPAAAINCSPDASTECVAESLRNSRAAVSVFVAEDSAFMQAIILRALRDAGYTRFQAFSNGEEPYLKIEQAAQSGGQAAVLDMVQLVVSDIEMPRRDGLALCRGVKKDLGLDQLPIILFSSLIDEQMQEKCREVGADAFATKRDGARLVALMDECVGLAQAVAA